MLLGSLGSPTFFSLGGMEGGVRGRVEEGKRGRGKGEEGERRIRVLSQ